MKEKAVMTDQTKVAGTNWKKLKNFAMQPDYKT